MRRKCLDLGAARDYDPQRAHHRLQAPLECARIFAAYPRLLDLDVLLGDHDEPFPHALLGEREIGDCVCRSWRHVGRPNNVCLWWARHESNDATSPV